jgi:AraC-like DNA-binding protein
MNIIFRYFLFLLICFFSTQLFAQRGNEIIFKLIDIPNNTPLEDSLFMVGTFNEWNPSDRRFVFRKNKEGMYEVTIVTILDSFEYKITRGGWQKVEGNMNGAVRPNRGYHVRMGKDVEIKVDSWEDLGVSNLNTFTLIIHKLPESTPFDASLFVVGNFNNWNPSDTKYKLQKNESDLYVIDIHTELKELEYKFTRGNWSSVEGRKNGRALPNRKTKFQEATNQQVVKIEISSWEDIEGEKFHLYSFSLILAAFQGILLCIAIATIQDNNRPANQLLNILLLLTSFVILARISVYYRNIFQLIPKLLLISDFILFLYAPIFLLYIQKLLTKDKIRRRFQWLMFVPILIQFLVYLPLFMAEKQTFINNIVDNVYHIYFEVFGGIALIFNAIIWQKSYQLVKNYNLETIQKYSFDQNVTHLYTVLIVQAICLIIWLLTYLISFASYLSDKQEEWRWLTETGIDAIWIMFSVTTYVLGYYAMNQPEVLKMRRGEMILPQEPIYKPQNQIPNAIYNLDTNPTTQLLEDKEKTIVVQKNAEPKVENLESTTPLVMNVETSSQKQYQSAMDKEELEIYKEKLGQLMEKEEPYLNQRLSIGEVAEMIKTNVHTLSRVINEGYQKNFYDFINHYRIQKFIQLANHEKFKHLTFLAIAMEVGFSSKSAFNRAFKKTTGVTPSEYFQDSKREED